ncbi:MAG: CDP-alcohol phosphatidyltransferase family protein [Firmicutes bacterium]|nr:CDP-alcohol phosphatidyltransferase family protein [Bacillota bacterium]
MNRIFTIPNILSMVRILLIPVFVDLYFKEKALLAGVVLVLSGLTDTLDGYIARRFNLITNLGKVLDPIADKLTQAVVAFCLCIQLPQVIPLLVLLVIKEFIMFVAGIWVIKRTGKPFSALWWGKVSTIIFYLAITILVLGSHMLPLWVIQLSVWVPFAALFFSLIMYCRTYVQIAKKQGSAV